MSETNISRFLSGTSISLAAVLLCAFMSTANANEAVIKISYTEIHDRILPTANVTSTHVQLEARLQQLGAVQQGEQRASGRGRESSSKDMKLGVVGRGAWRVSGPNQIVNVVNYPSYERAILVTIEGSSCSVRVGYTLKPGYSDYRYPRLKTKEPAVARSVTAQGLSCSIQ